MSQNRESLDPRSPVGAGGDAVGPDAVEHAWRYLTLYSTQRLQLLRFYIFSSAVFTAALLASMLGRSPFDGAALGFSLSMVFTTFIFWKLEQRTEIRVRQGESTILEIERRFPRGDIRPFGSERGTLQSLTMKPQGAVGTWSYSRIARATFVAGGSVGSVGVLIALARLTGWIG